MVLGDEVVEGGAGVGVGEDAAGAEQGLQGAGKGQAEVGGWGGVAGAGELHWIILLIADGEGL